MEKQSWKILLITDTEQVMTLIRILLSKTRAGQPGLQYSASFEEASSRLQSGDLDVILLDEEVEGKVGLEFVRQAVEANYNIPIVLLANQADEGLEMQASEAGAADMLVKGELTPPLLERTIRLAIQRKRSEDALRRAHTEIEKRVDQRTRELAETNALLEHVFSSIHMGIVYLDKQFNFKRVNNTYAEFNAKEPKDFVGKNFFELFPNPENKAIFQQVMDSGEPYVEHSRPGKGGFYWDGSLQPVLDTEGDVQGLVLGLVDVSERQRASESLRQKTSSIQLLQEVAVAANEAPNSQEALQFAIDRVCEFTGWPLGHVLFTEPGNPDRLVSTNLWYCADQEHFREFCKQSEHLQIERGTGLSGRALAGEEVLWKDNVLETLVPERAEAAGKAGLRGGLAFPVLSGQEATAVLEFFSTEALSPDEATLDVISNIGTQLGRVIERDQAEESLRRHAARSEALSQFSQLLAQAGPADPKILDIIARRVVDWIGDSCSITLLSEDKQLLNTVSVYHPDPEALTFLMSTAATSTFRVGEGFAGRVAQTGEPILIVNQTAEQILRTMKPEYRSYLERFGLTSALIVPLRVHGEVIGTLGISRGRPDQPYTIEDQAFLQELANRAALAIVNARLFQETRKEIVERKRAEEALQKSMAMFERLFESAPDAALVVDQEGKILRVNHQAQEKFGYCVDELSDQGLDFIIPNAWRSDYKEERIQYLENPSIRELGLGLDLYGRRKDGSQFPVDVTISPLQQEGGFQIICMVRDITSRKQAEQALRESEMRFRTIFEESAMGITLKSLEGHIIATNPALQEMLGYSDEEMRQMTLDDLTHPKDRALARAYFNRLARGEIQRYRMEKRYLHKDGSPVWVRQYFSLVCNTDGQPQFAIGMVENINERKQVETELAEVQRRLMDSREDERLRLARELHDGPMQDLYAVSYLVETLKDGTMETEMENQLVLLQETVLQITQVLRGLAVDLRPPTLTSFGLQKTIEGHAENFQQQYPELRLKLDLMEDGQSIPEGVRLALFRIYQQSLANIARHARANQVEIRLSLDEQQIILEIQDNGVGFEVPKRWVELARHGHLGLAGAAERAQAIGGKFSVVSGPGKGTLIRVVVPRQAVNEDQPIPFAAI